MLFSFANRRWIADLEADESMKLTFFPIFANDAMAKKYCGIKRQDISMNIDKL